MNELYNRDFSVWAEKQIECLNTGQLDRLDINNLRIEIEHMILANELALKNRIESLLVKLLEWQREQTDRSLSMVEDIVLAQEEIRDSLEISPSLSSKAEAMLKAVYAKLLTQYQHEDIALPESCPWSMEDVLRLNTLNGTN